MAFKAYFCGKFFPAGPPHDEPPGDKGLDNRFDIPDEPRGDICDPCKPKFPRLDPSGGDKDVPHPGCPCCYVPGPSFPHGPCIPDPTIDCSVEEGPGCPGCGPVGKKASCVIDLTNCEPEDGCPRCCRRVWKPGDGGGPVTPTASDSGPGGPVTPPRCPPCCMWSNKPEDMCGDTSGCKRDDERYPCPAKHWCGPDYVNPDGTMQYADCIKTENPADKCSTYGYAPAKCCKPGPCYKKKISGPTTPGPTGPGPTGPTTPGPTGPATPVPTGPTGPATPGPTTPRPVLSPGGCPKCCVRARKAETMCGDVSGCTRDPRYACPDKHKCPSVITPFGLVQDVPCVESEDYTKFCNNPQGYSVRCCDHDPCPGADEQKTPGPSTGGPVVPTTPGPAGPGTFPGAPGPTTPGPVGPTTPGPAGPGTFPKTPGPSTGGGWGGWYGPWTPGPGVAERKRRPRKGPSTGGPGGGGDNCPPCYIIHPETGECTKDPDIKCGKGSSPNGTTWDCRENTLCPTGCGGCAPCCEAVPGTLEWPKEDAPGPKPGGKRTGSPVVPDFPYDISYGEWKKAKEAQASDAGLGGGTSTQIGADGRVLEATYDRNAFPTHRIWGDNFRPTTRSDSDSGLLEVNQIGGEDGRGFGGVLDLSRYNPKMAMTEQTKRDEMEPHSLLYDSNKTFLFGKKSSVDKDYKPNPFPDLKFLGDNVESKVIDIIKKKKTSDALKLYEFKELASVITNLKNNYELKTRWGTPYLTWWDILSRLPASTIFSLGNSIGEPLLNAIANGEIFGVKIKHINAKGDAASKTGLKKLTGTEVSPILTRNANEELDFTNFMNLTNEDMESSMPAPLGARTSFMVDITGSRNKNSNITIAHGILSNIMKGNFDAIDIGYIEDLLNRQQKIHPLTLVPGQSEEATIAFILDYIINYASPLSASSYSSERDKAMMKNFFVPYTEVDARVQIVDSDGEARTLTIDNGGGFIVYDSNGVNVGAQILGGYSVPIVRADGGTTMLPMTTEVDHAYALNTVLNSIISKQLASIGHVSDITSVTLEASKVGSDIETNPVTTSFDGHYILSANFSTYTKTSITPFITEVSLEYDVITAETTAALEEKVTNLYKFTSNYWAGNITGGDSDGNGADLMLHYIIQGGKVKYTTRYFTTENYSTLETKALPISISNIPKLIFLTTKNTTKYNIGGGYSKLVSWQNDIYTRQLKFTTSPDPKQASSGLGHAFFQMESTSPGVDVDNKINIYSIKYFYDKDNLPNKDFE